MLSIIILTCNQCDLTMRCLDSLDHYMSAYQDSEVILIDNGSIDTTESRIESNEYIWRHRLRYVKMDCNRGVAAGRNEGLRSAAGDVVMFLDNDTIVTAGAIGELYSYIINHRTVGIAAPRLCSPSGDIQQSAKPYPGLFVKVRNLLGKRRDIISCHEIDPQPCYVIGACQIMRRDVIERVGTLDERIFYGPEDADYCIRVRNLGYEVRYLPDISIIHDWQRASGKNIFSKLAWRHFCGLVYFYWKHKRII